MRMTTRRWEVIPQEMCELTSLWLQWLFARFLVRSLPCAQRPKEIGQIWPLRDPALWPCASRFSFLLSSSGLQQPSLLSPCPCPTLTAAWHSRYCTPPAWLHRIFHSCLLCDLMPSRLDLNLFSLRTFFVFSRLVSWRKPIPADSD